MTNWVIDVNDLVKTFANKTVVNKVSLQIPKGEVWGFLGPNGSGKTTTIRMICGLLTPTSGRGSCLGYDIIKEAEKIKLLSGYMTQKFSFWDDLSIRENLEFVAQMYNLKNKKQTVNTTLDKLKLQQRQHQLASTLSGGWKQRLALAAVTMHKPQLLLLDEPTAGVDPQARREFWDEIHQLAEQGITILVSTHYMDEAERCDQIVYIAHGELITQGSVTEVIASSKLITYQGVGENSRHYASQLKNLTDIDNSGYFGSKCHISGKNQAKIETIIQQAPFSSLSWQQTQPSLEDVFIALLNDAGNDKRGY